MLKLCQKKKLAHLADTEVIADACETMLKNSKIFEDIAQGNPSLAQKIKNVLRNFINRIKDMLGSMEALTDEGIILEKCVNDLEQIQKLWDKAVTSGIKTLNVTKVEQKNNTDSEEGAKKQERSQEINIDNKDLEVLRNIGGKSINDFTSEDIQKSEKWERKFYDDLKNKSPFFRAWFGDWRAFDTKSLTKIDKVTLAQITDINKFIKKSMS